MSERARRLVSAATWQVLDAPVVHADCLAAMRQLPDCSVDAIVTDPPYGLSSEPDIAEVMAHWLAGDSYEHTASGFMGREWDSFVPGPEYWREAHRILKPGGHLLAFGGTRCYDMLVIALRLARFEIRDSLIYGFGAGFPKSLDVSKKIDDSAGVKRGAGTQRLAGVEGDDTGIYGAGKGNRPCLACGKWMFGGNPCRCSRDSGPVTEDAKRWDGWGTALKPSWEPIVVARKPLVGTVVGNVLEHHTGAININGCRVAHRTVNGGNLADNPHLRASIRNSGSTFGADGELVQNPDGRWPANILLSHTEECVLVGDGKVGGMLRPGAGYADADGIETVDAWRCAPGCPVAEVDHASGTRRSAGVYAKGSRSQGTKQGAASIPIDGTLSATYDDSGGASRFFYCAKASTAEREAGLLGKIPCAVCGELDSTDHETADRKRESCRRNSHPTVKPLDLIRWLVRLVTPLGGMVLDPFCGSGTTGCAAALEGFDFVGMEMANSPEERFVDIALTRITWWAAHPAGIDVPSALAACAARDAVTAAGQLGLFAHSATEENGQPASVAASKAAA